MALSLDSLGSNSSTPRTGTLVPYTGFAAIIDEHY